MYIKECVRTHLKNTDFCVRTQYEKRMKKGGNAGGRGEEGEGRGADTLFIK